MYIISFILFCTDFFKPLCVFLFFNACCFPPHFEKYHKCLLMFQVNTAYSSSHILFLIQILIKCFDSYPNTCMSMSQKIQKQKSTCSNMVLCIVHICSCINYVRFIFVVKKEIMLDISVCFCGYEFMLVLIVIFLHNYCISLSLNTF